MTFVNRSLIIMKFSIAYLLYKLYTFFVTILSETLEAQINSSSCEKFTLRTFGFDFKLIKRKVI